MHWILRATHWWNTHCESVISWACIFVAGMIVGSCTGFAQ